MIASGTEARFYTPPQLARRWGVSPDKVVAWIRRGELAAVNVVDRVGGRARWRISPQAVALFEAARSATPTPAPAPRRKRAETKPAGWVDYF